MERIYIKNVKDYADKEIILSGFIDNIRNLQYVCFIILRDKTGKIQITIEKEGNEELVKSIENLTNESTINVTGIVKINEKVKLNGVEITPSKIEITSISALELPFNYKNIDQVSLDTRLDNRFIDLRNERYLLLFEVQSYLIRMMREYLYQNEFTEIHTPKLIGTASESGSEVFEVKYFDTKAYLAQSPQFYKQMAISSGFDRVFEVAPAFRAEKSNSYKHTTEFTSFDVEMSYIDSYNDVMKLEENLLEYALNKVKEKYNDKVKEYFNTEIIVPKVPFPRMTLEDLCLKLEEKYHYQIPKEDIGDMNSEMEKLTSKFALEEYGHEFIFITDFSKVKRPFYHMRNGDIPQGYDLIWKGCEITSGSQREHRYDILIEQANEKGLGKDVEFYLEFFKYGCPPHGGFAIGVDRITMLLLNMPNLKETMFLFRGPNRISP